MILKYIGLFALVASVGEGIYTRITTGNIYSAMSTFLVLFAIACFAASTAFRSTK